MFKGIGTRETVGLLLGYAQGRLNVLLHISAFQSIYGHMAKFFVIVWILLCLIRLLVIADLLWVLCCLTNTIRLYEFNAFTFFFLQQRFLKKVYCRLKIQAQKIQINYTCHQIFLTSTRQILSLKMRGKGVFQEKTVSIVAGKKLYLIKTFATIIFLQGDCYSYPLPIHINSYHLLGFYS